MPVRPGRPFGMPATPFNPATGTYLPLSTDAQGTGGTALAIEIMTVSSEENDYLICVDSSDQEVYVAKPFTLRRTPYDGVTWGDVSYVYSAANTRVASAAGETDETQKITPSYEADETIVAVAHDTGVLTSFGEIAWEDLNTAGRAWAVEAD
jgi:hypothetical protein